MRAVQVLPGRPGDPGGERVQELCRGRRADPDRTPVERREARDREAGQPEAADARRLEADQRSDAEARPTRPVGGADRVRAILPGAAGPLSAQAASIDPLLRVDGLAKTF